VPAIQTLLPGQTIPQLPQLLISVDTSRQKPLQLVSPDRHGTFGVFWAGAGGCVIGAVVAEVSKTGWLEVGVVFDVIHPALRMTPIVRIPISTPPDKVEKDFILLST